MSNPLQTNMNSAFYSSHIQFTYNWIIEDFKNRKEKKGEILWSDPIGIHEPDGRVTKWKLMFFPKGDKRANEGEMSLFLSSMNHFDVKISFTCSILDASTGAKMKSFSLTDKLFTRRSPSSSRLYNGSGTLAFCKQEDLIDNPQWFVYSC